MKKVQNSNNNDGEHKNKKKVDKRQKKIYFQNGKNHEESIVAKTTPFLGR